MFKHRYIYVPYFATKFYIYLSNLHKDLFRSKRTPKSKRFILQRLYYAQGPNKANKNLFLAVVDKKSRFRKIFIDQQGYVNFCVFHSDTIYINRKIFILFSNSGKLQLLTNTHISIYNLKFLKYLHIKTGFILLNAKLGIKLYLFPLTYSIMFLLLLYMV